MHPELIFQAELANLYKYKPLPKELSIEVRAKYLAGLEKVLWTYPEGDNEVFIYTPEGTLIATGYNRVVIGDYGAFLEINKDMILLDQIQVKKGQEFRYEERFKTCKYYWLTAKDGSDIKIYHQKRKVSYADYKTGKYYISPYEVQVKEQEWCWKCDWSNSGCHCGDDGRRGG